MVSNTIFIFAYYSYKDPVFQSAVLPYFVDFPEKEKFKFILLTFEQEKYQLNKQEKEEIKQFLAQNNIHWHTKKWHSGHFKIFKKGYDFLVSMIFSLYLIVKFKPKFIYSEGFPGAIITHFLSKITGKKHIVHTFEPHADYMIESGVWEKTSWEARFIKKMELKIAQNAFAILTATNLYIEKFKPICPNTQFFRVPSCVDLELFQYAENQRIKKRKELDLSENDCLLVYLGKFGGMYWDEEVFDLFDYFKKNGNENYKLLIISKDNQLQFSHRLNEHIFWINADRNEVPSWLSASDLAICGIKNIRSRRFSSPIKNGEYWAMGLKVIILEGISDDYISAQELSIGYVLKNNSEIELRKILHTIENNPESFHKSLISRDFIEKDRSIKQYKNLYFNLFIR
jgi:hypothetical protein